MARNLYQGVQSRQQQANLNLTGQPYRFPLMTRMTPTGLGPSDFLFGPVRIFDMA
jgi:hypothetical protein